MIEEALGGLLQDEYTGNQEKVPGLADIPLLGNLFKSESRGRKKTNLMVFIHPVILKDEMQVADITQRRYDFMREVQQNYREKKNVEWKKAPPILPDFEEYVPAGKNADAYIDTICLPALTAAHAEGLVDAVDGFCEGIAFQPNQIARVFDVARELGLPVKLHAEQLSNLGGAKLAAQYGALSADHIEYLDVEGVAAMARAGTVAVILPGAFYTLRETQAPPISTLRDCAVPIALASDCNPGSSPMTSLLLTMNMACTLFRMTPEEALCGVTRNAAKALGLKDCGQIVAGARADLAVWNVQHPAELSYRIGFNPLHARIFGGEF